MVKDHGANIGMIGLGVMGRNLALNMADHGYAVAVYDRVAAVTRHFVSSDDRPGGIAGCRSMRELVGSLERPRRVMMMVPAGSPVDAVIRSLRPLLEQGDVLIDGGNSLFTDTIRRERELAGGGLHFVGSGVSGGEEGARFGPSLMPGGSREAWQAIRPVWRAIAARVDRQSGRALGGAQPGRPVRGGVPCTTHIGSDGAGHYVKMVHNGIEYADMQLICEAYFLLRRLLGLHPGELSRIFARWNRGDLDSFLIEISADILQQRDPADPDRYLIDSVLDTAGQKGTGKWTSINALDLGVTAPTIGEAVFARFVSALKDQRVAAAELLDEPTAGYRGARRGLIEAVRDALYCSRLCAYAQGFALMARAGAEYGWKLDFTGIARIWRGGCIIRARQLHKIAEAFDHDRRLPNLLLDPYFRRKIRRARHGWREVVAVAARHGVPCPAFMSALAYYDGYRTARLPADLLQAQRDYFGAHGFERIDRPRGRKFHVDWPHPDRPLIER